MVMTHLYTERSLSNWHSKHMMRSLLLNLFLLATAVVSFSVAPKLERFSTQLYSDNDKDFMKWARQSRSAQADDTVVALNRPLGLILNQDENGNVYVEKVVPRGNAARSGQVKEGDIVTMCSATFGDEMWSTRGVGLSRVMAAIRVRSGATVKLVLESPQKYQKKKAKTETQLKKQYEAEKAAQAKKDALLSELEKDEKKLNPKKFFGLF